MFGNYSVATASRHPSSLPMDGQDDYYSFDACEPPRSISPCQTQSTYRSMSMSMSQLSRQFDCQRLEVCPIEDEVDSWNYTAAQRRQSITSNATPAMPLSPRAPRYVRRRSQRQRDVRLQCDPAHLRSISELVERMVASEDQCGVSRPRPASLVLASAQALEDDDAYDDSDLSSPRSDSSFSSPSASRSSWLSAEDMLLHCRRSNEVLAPSAGTPKDNRVQKTRHRRSSGRERK